MYCPCSIELRHLRYFVAASKNGSFRKASTALGVQLSAVSRHIRDLEDEIGFTLFERNNMGVRLTEAAEQYLPDVRAALRHLDQAVIAAQAVVAGQRGRLRLAVSKDAMTITLTRILTAHRARWPEVCVDLIEMSPLAQLHALRSGLAERGLPDR